MTILIDDEFTDRARDLLKAGFHMRGPAKRRTAMSNPDELVDTRVSEADELRDWRSLFGEPPKPAPAARTDPAIRPDGQRACAICGAPAYFGFGVSIRGGREGRWACMEHREAVEAIANERKPR